MYCWFLLMTVSIVHDVESEFLGGDGNVHPSLPNVKFAGLVRQMAIVDYCFVLLDREGHLAALKQAPTCINQQPKFVELIPGGGILLPSLYYTCSSCREMELYGQLPYDAKVLLNWIDRDRMLLR